MTQVRSRLGAVAVTMLLTGAFAVSGCTIPSVTHTTTSEQTSTVIPPAPPPVTTTTVQQTAPAGRPYDSGMTERTTTSYVPAPVTTTKRVTTSVTGPQ